MLCTSAKSSSVLHHYVCIFLLPLPLAVLDNVFKRIPEGSNTKWNFNSQLVNTVSENKDILT